LNRLNVNHESTWWGLCVFPQVEQKIDSPSHNFVDLLRSQKKLSSGLFPLFTFSNSKQSKMTLEINQEALEAYSRTKNSQSSYSSELDYLPSSGLESPPMSPAPRNSITKNKPTIDRSLRVDSWVGGCAPDGAKPRRSWTVKGEIKR
jgi:hypothetical protein